MRKKLVVLLMILAAALMALPTMAQQQEWQSTSTMQTSGSAYTPQVNAVGATGVSEMATTTGSSTPAKAPNGPRRSHEGTSDPGQGNPGSPIGDAVLPLMLCAAVFCGFIAFRRKRSALKG